MISTIITKYRVTPDTLLFFTRDNSNWVVDYFEISIWSDRPNELSTVIYSHPVKKNGMRRANARTQATYVHHDPEVNKHAFFAEQEVKQHMALHQPPPF